MSFHPGLAEFDGAWRLRRTIADHRDGPDGRFEGRAVFTPEGPGLAYREEGVLRLTGQPPLAASRSCFWRADGPSRVAVSFPDGRPFHAFDLATGAEAVHLCGEDSYRVAYDFGAWPAWQATWRVTGPRKDYTMVSRYTR